MAMIKVYNQQNKETGEITLNPEIFEVEVRPEILNLVVRQYRAGLRAGTHSTKTRAFVSGGGKKPYKQKGTGNARAGSNRSPIWRGGAVVFGPSPRDYSFKVNKKIRKLALKMAWSSRLTDKAITVINNIELAEMKTKHFVKVTKDLGLDKALFVLPENDRTLELAARNITGITMLSHNEINVYEILKHKHIILLEPAIEKIQARLS